MTVRSPVSEHQSSRRERATRSPFMAELPAAIDEDAALSRRVVTLAMIGFGVAFACFIGLVFSLSGRWLQ